jgi:hypothetical protein
MVKTNTIDRKCAIMSTRLPVDAHSFIFIISVIAKMSMIKTAVRYRMHIMEPSATFRQGESSGSEVAPRSAIAYLAAYTGTQDERLRC